MFKEIQTVIYAHFLISKNMTMTLNQTREVMKKKFETLDKNTKNHVKTIIPETDFHIMHSNKRK
jgi:hypothetical protein